MGMPALEHRRFTVEEYHRMAEAGILTQEDRVELLRGVVVPMTPIGVEHAACVKRLNRLFRAADVTVGVQDPVILGPHEEPEPDLSLLRFQDDGYAAHHPRAADILLLIEVADTSLSRDREKVALYAEAGIPEAWIVNLPDGVVEVYRQPEGDRYRERTVVRTGQVIRPSLIPKLAIDVAEILIIG